MGYSKAEYEHDVKVTNDSYDRGAIDRETWLAQIKQYVEWYGKLHPNEINSQKKRFGIK